jgi:hypothetical protein
MRPALAYLHEPQTLKERDDLPRFEDGEGARHYATWIVWTPTNSDSSVGSPSSRSISITS